MTLKEHPPGPLAPTVLPSEPSLLLPVVPFCRLGASHSFVSAGANSERLRVSYFRRLSDCALVAKVWFGPEAEGPPGCAHGGSIAAVLDEALGAAAWMHDIPVVSARLEISFKRRLQLRATATVEAEIVEENGRKLLIHGSLFGPDREEIAEATGLFVAAPDLELRRTVRNENQPGT